MANTYDFYKPNLSSEYPEVDGPVSVVTYIAALDAAYSAFKEKHARYAKRIGVKTEFSLEDVDYAIFHSPYGKQAVKGHARMLFNDFLSSPAASRFANIPNPDAFLKASHAESLRDKNVEKTFITAGKPGFAEKVDPAMACSRRLGNMYTASLYGCLASLLSNVGPSTLKGKRFSLFAFGSGCAASFFTARVKGDTTDIREKLDLINRLAQMMVVPPQGFVDALLVSLVIFNDFVHILIDVLPSFVRRTTTPLTTFPRARSTTSGLVLTTSRAWTQNTGGSTCVHPSARKRTAPCIECDIFVFAVLWSFLWFL
jgi:hydroxymethylglutaryl-CoA synthase